MNLGQRRERQARPAAGREMPLGGGFYYHEREHRFDCQGCLTVIEVRWMVYENPERLALIKQLLELDHRDCWRCASAEEANNARNRRKDRERLKMLSPRGLSLVG